MDHVSANTNSGALKGGEIIWITVIASFLWIPLAATQSVHLKGAFEKHPTLQGYARYDE